MEMQDPYVQKIVRNFKTIEHSTKHGALLSTGL